MLKDSAKKGEKESCRVLAKEIVNARKAVNRLHASKAHLSSVQLSMKQQLGEDERHNKHTELVMNYETSYDIYYICIIINMLAGTELSLSVV